MDVSGKPGEFHCLRLIRALCVETHEGWLEDKRYLNMGMLWEARKEQLRKAEVARLVETDFRDW
jgi:hypothetical protein